MFIVSAAALVALAWIVGVATEQLGASAGPKVGGVLNATFGNAAELIITIFAIRAGQLEVATASITGSILGNTLLVLGASFFIGGLRNGLQSFNQRVAGMNASMLALAVIGLGIPTLFGHVADHPDVQAVSDVTAGHPAHAVRADAGVLLPHAGGGPRLRPRTDRAALAGPAGDAVAAALDGGRGGDLGRVRGYARRA